mmetsp:Transcript_129392/g.413477  ORF Transcript_129392/g.413477 Transcript_129392/m.413477 type:complete len:92 (+) Transcript_129392:1-276(+)
MWRPRLARRFGVEVTICRFLLAGCGVFRVGSRLGALSASARSQKETPSDVHIGGKVIGFVTAASGSGDFRSHWCPEHLPTMRQQSILEIEW